MCWTRKRKMTLFKKGKNRVSEEAANAIDIIERWYGFLDYYFFCSDEQQRVKKEKNILINVIKQLDEEKRADHLRFVKMFKKLFSKEKKELKKKCEKIQIELLKEKQHVRELEKIIEEKKDD